MSPDTLPLITLILIPAWARRPHSSGWRNGPSGPVGSFWASSSCSCRSATP